MRGIADLNAQPLSEGRLRRHGGGRKRLEEKDEDLKTVLESLVEPLSRGDPESPLRWTCKSTRSIAAELGRAGKPISHAKVGSLLRSMEYSLQSNRKTEDGKDHPDRDAQFNFINFRVKEYLTNRWPVVSVDTKKKELVGNYENKGRKWLKSKQPDEVQTHDFPDPSVPRAYPYGIYDIGRNVGFVNVGTDHDTAEFAVASLLGWWQHDGRKEYSGVDRILITADGGGSNGYRLRLWKRELQRFADSTGLQVAVSHFPPGTSKWNKVEHRLFSFISSNWRGEPLQDYETIVQLIAHTTTTAGLRVKCRLDHRKYCTGKRVSDYEYSKIRIVQESFHGEWNYSVLPT
jgi:hypothetical protein